MLLVSLATVLFVLGVEGVPVEKRLNNGVGITPAMGWNNYNSGLSPTAVNAINASNAFISLGLKELGYTYINMDDGWPSMTRDASGNLVADPAKFPNGIPGVTSYIHGLGLKFGLYGDSGTATCAGYPGSEGYETQDAAQLASWGVDYWKYDNCNTPSGNSSTRYITMRNALLAQSHTILYSLCQWGVDSVWTWGASVGNSWRVGGDITDSWSSIASIAANNAPIAAYAQPGGFNDFDMMEIGNGGLTAAQERAHFGLWAISKSPLLLGCDLTKISASSLAVITNAGVIAINQDSLGKAATTFQPTGQAAPVSGTLYPYWSGQLSDGYVIGLVAANGAATLTASFADVPGLGAGTYSWKELYSGTTGTGSSVSAALTADDMAIFKVTTGTVVKTTATSSTTTSKASTPSTTTTTSSKPASTTTTTSLSTTSKQPSSTATTTTNSSSSTTKASASASSTSSSGGTIPDYGQCGGIGWTGSGTCMAPYTCHVQNPCKYTILSMTGKRGVSNPADEGWGADYSQCY